MVMFARRRTHAYRPSTRTNPNEHNKHATKLLAATLTYINLSTQLAAQVKSRVHLLPQPWLDMVWQQDTIAEVAAEGLVLEKHFGPEERTAPTTSSKENTVMLYTVEP